MISAMVGVKMINDKTIHCKSSHCKQNKLEVVPKIVFLSQSPKNEELKHKKAKQKQKPDTLLFGFNRMKYPIIVSGWPTSWLGRLFARFSSPLFCAFKSLQYWNADILIVQDSFWLAGILRRLKLLPPVIFTNIALYVFWNRSNRFVRWLVRNSAEGMDLTLLLRKRYPPFENSFKGKTLFIPLGVDTEFYSKDKYTENKYDKNNKTNKNKLSKIESINKKNKKIKNEQVKTETPFVLSSGGFQRDYDAIIDFAEQYGEKVIIVASGKNKISRNAPDNVEILRDIPVTHIRELYRDCLCAVLFFEKDILNQHYHGQTTVLELLAYNKHIITKYQEWFADYNLDKNPNLHFVNSPAEATEIVKYINIKHAKNIHSQSSRSLVEKRFSTKARAKIAEKIVEEFIYKECAEKIF